jgi:transcription antitermination factor NusG
MENKWYILYTKSGCEKKVSALLSKRKIVNYCPYNKIVRNLIDKDKIIKEPLFVSNVFVKASEIDIYKIKKSCQDIINFVYWIGKPAVVKDEEIENIKFFLEEYNDVKLERKDILLTDKIIPVKRPYIDIEGIISGIKNKYVYMEIQSLGYRLKAEYKISKVEVIKMEFEQNNIGITDDKHSFSWN